MSASRDKLDSLGLLLDDEAILAGTKLRWPENDAVNITDKLLKNDVVVLSLQDFLISNDLVSALTKHVEKGKGLVMFGMPPLKAPPSMPPFLRDFFEWVGYQPHAMDSIKRGFGFRIVNDEHTITHAMNIGDIFRTSFHEGKVMIELKKDTSEATKSLTRQLVEQRVILEKKGEEAGSIVIPALVVCERGELKGRIVHFNFGVQRVDGVLSPLINRAISWAAKVDMQLLR